MVTYCLPRDLPEGGSPRAYDVDFDIGSVRTRNGLASVYSYASSLTITQVVFSSGGATFTYQGTNPTTNEGFVLSGFTGSAFFLNAMQIVVTSVNTTTHTFTAVLSGIGAYTNLNGTAISTTGLFIGPNVPTVATDVINGSPWVNPNGILGNSTFASTTLGIGQQDGVTGTASNAQPGSPAWTNLSSIYGNSSAATVTLSQSSSQFNSIALLAVPSGLSLPSGATVSGIQIAMQAAAVYSGSSPATAGPDGAGSGAGTSWSSPNNVTLNNGSFASYFLTPGSTSTPLTVEGFGFSIPVGATVTGVTASVYCMYSVIGNPQAVVGSARLLKAGIAVGVAKPVAITTTAATKTLGNSSDLWGTTITASDVNSSTFGIQLTGEAVLNFPGPTPPKSGNANVFYGYITFTVAYSTGSGVGNASCTVQLAKNGTAVGLTATDMLTTSLSPFSQGSSGYLWGTAFSVADINNGLGILITANAGSTYAAGSSYMFQANSLTATVFFTTDTSDALQATTFTFAMPATSGVTGIGTTLQSYATGAGGSISVQLLKNGLPVGQPIPQALTTTPTVYALGGANNLWGSTWLFSDVNNTQFGVQIIAKGLGTVNVNDVDMLVYIAPGLSNFNYVKSYIQNSDQTYTLALDSAGILWEENVTSNPGVLYAALSGILPGSFAKSATMNNKEFICFSDLSIGTERPRVYNGTTFRPLSQIGPGAPPTFTTVQASGEAPLVVTAYAVSGGIITVTFNTATIPVVGSLYVLSGTGNANIDNHTFSVIGVPPPSTTQFSAAAGAATGSASGLTGAATATNYFNITSIKQDSTTTPPPPGQPAAGPFTGQAANFNGQEQLWSAGPNLGPGFIYTNYYSGANAPINWGIANSVKNNYPLYMWIQGAFFANGSVQAATSATGIPPSETAKVPYFTVTAPSSGNQRHGGPNSNFGPGNTGTFQLSLATVTTASPIPSINAGDSISITGATPAAWNATWTVVDSLDSGQYLITSSQVTSQGTVTFQYENASATGQAAVTNGQTISLSQLVNNVAFNTIGVVSAATGTTFQVVGFSGAIPVQTNSIPESGQAVTFGQKFLIDPGSVTVSTQTNPIFGDTSVGGTVSVIGGQQIPIGVGIRQGVVYFITDNGYETQVSSPFEFTTPQGSQQILVANIPIGPPNVVARGLAFTEAGQNGIPGDNFYVIMEPVTTTVNATTIVMPSTIIHDNITTSVTLSFTDAVLLNSREIDVQGDNLFNLIELGSSAWCVPYTSRMFYGLQLNKINNWTSGGGLTFDAGYLDSSNPQPLGWSLVNSVDQSLVISPVTGQALYIKNQGVATATVGTIFQTAWQDVYHVAIVQPNVAYSVRVAASAPSGLTGGTLTIDLTNNNPGTGFGQTSFGTFTVPLSSMSSVDQVFTGTLLTTPFITVPSALVIRVALNNAAPGADCLIDRIEVFPTDTPYLKAQVYGSYVGQPEAIDASSTGGVVDTTNENAQPAMGGFVMHDLMYILKTQSWYSMQDNPNSEPGGWGLHEVSTRVGSCGIHAYDYGEEWCLTACRDGIFGFDGGQPHRVSGEIFNLWNEINWNAADTIVLRNDIDNRRFYCWVPLPTGVNPTTGIPVGKYSFQCLPNAPYNPAPSSPNVCLVCNYIGLESAQELFSEAGVHATMFGTLADVDLRRKWSIYQVPSPYADFITDAEGSRPMYVCSGTGSSKIYQFIEGQHSDDGVAINSAYCTYGFTNATKAATLPLFGFQIKRYTMLQGASQGVGQMRVTAYPNTLEAKYPYSVPNGIKLANPAFDDWFRPTNLKGNRIFLEFGTNAVNSYFNLSKVLLAGIKDPWSAVSPTGGMNAGITP